jgi:hypothetical protein
MGCDLTFFLPICLLAQLLRSDWVVSLNWHSDCDSKGCDPGRHEKMIVCDVNVEELRCKLRWDRRKASQCS